MSERDRYLDFAKELAQDAGKIMRHYFHEKEQGVSWKDDQTPLTLADTKINSLVAESIRKTYPEHGLVGEEESIDLDNDFIWVCDPIDGTVQFMGGAPISTFNLALVHNGKTIVAVQYDPWLDRLYSAIRGKGTYLNGRKIQIRDDIVGRKVVNLEIYGRLGSTMFVDDSVKAEAELALPSSEFIVLKYVSVGYSVGLVTAGKIAAAVFSGTYPYEAATCNLLVTEAGGKFSNIFGQEDNDYAGRIKGFIAAPPKIHADIVRRLSPVVKKAKIRDDL
jgi:myo-inositol-1(or 4)-monophosphatase